MNYKKKIKSKQKNAGRHTKTAKQQTCCSVNQISLSNMNAHNHLLYMIKSLSLHTIMFNLGVEHLGL